jgi:hypothetical protein
MHFEYRARIALLAALPAVGTAIGAWLDESARLGLSTWRSACRVQGISLTSVMQFTWQLLPNAILGALLGGLAVVCLGYRWRRCSRAEECLMAHVGCVLAMPLALLACSLSLPVSLMPVVDAGLGGATALLLWKLFRPQRPTAHP